MRKASIRANHVRFEARLDSVQGVVERIFHPNSGLDAAERDLCLEGLALLLASYWEELIDDDFVDALNRDTRQYAAHVGVTLPKNLSRDICFRLLVGSGYLDFRSVEELQRQARNLLVQANNPFRHIRPLFRQVINDFLRLRNYLAHRSQKAYRAYSQMLSDRYQYQRSISPGQFLRVQLAQPRQRRYSYFVDVFRQTSEAMRRAAPFKDHRSKTLPGCWQANHWIVYVWGLTSSRRVGWAMNPPPSIGVSLTLLPSSGCPRADFKGQFEYIAGRATNGPVYLPCTSLRRF